MFCSSCGAKVSPSGKFCSSCGQPLDSNDQATLALHLHNVGSPAPPSISSPVTGSDPVGGGRFAAGQVIAARYRVVALAGRGGMGEVYRAEDLKLEQVVAIKFLPESLSVHREALARFHSEVRIARQVSHPNVCRVFDIGDVDGSLFLTMEYVDGEDLASLVRRVGRLSPDKAMEIARQICAGLAAAHDRGVIHRDLKPANVMLDGSGKIRVMDFGLASIAASIQGAEARAGTPAYMAPEQLAGKEVTTKSDIYSLGLILYEILTGKRAYEATTMSELLKLRKEREIKSPSALVRDLDPLIERVILRCLENDPGQRPASALQVAAALPGGDPLAAALAAGVTPSPEMVAAAGESEGLNPRIGLLCFLGVCVALVALFLVGKRTRLVGFLPFGESPEVLRTRAKDMITTFGYSESAADTASGFVLQESYLQYIQANQKTTNRWEVLRQDEPPALAFWYRQAPELPASFARIEPNEPPITAPNSELVMLSLQGRLLHFEAVPTQVDETTAPAPPPDWTALFAAAAIDPQKLKQVAPKSSLAGADTRAAWEGTWPTRSDVPLRVEAAAFRGKSIYFQLFSPWDRPQPKQVSGVPDQESITLWIVGALFSLIIPAGIWIAKRNLQSGRADLKGSVRLALFVLVVMLVYFSLLGHHVWLLLAEPARLLRVVGGGLILSAIIWMLYIALEPIIRRRWPTALISWTRLLSGQFKDPALGRDILFGTLLGLSLLVLQHLQPIVEVALGKPPIRPLPLGYTTETLEGLHGVMAAVFYQMAISVFLALFLFFVFFLVHLILRKNWLAALTMALLFGIPSLVAQNPVIDMLFIASVWFAAFSFLYRYGLLALVAAGFADYLGDAMPIALPLNAWYTEGGLLGVAVILLFAFYGFQTSRAGKPLFGLKVLDASIDG
jgi:Protein kinase domain